MEAEDIRQELCVDIIEYCGRVSIEDRSMGAIHVIINRKLYRLIRNNAKFEGCSAKSKVIRRLIANPISLDMPLRISDHHQEPNTLTLMSTIVTAPDNHGDTVTLIDFITNFKKERLTVTEKEVFEYMLQGLNKPRFVCLEKRGEVITRVSKTLSKHINSVKAKFRKEWLVVYGKQIERAGAGSKS